MRIVNFAISRAVQTKFYWHAGSKGFELEHYVIVTPSFSEHLMPA